MISACSPTTPQLWVDSTNYLEDLAKHFQLKQLGDQSESGYHIIALKKERDVRKVARRLQGLPEEIRVLPHDQLMFSADTIATRGTPLNLWLEIIEKEPLPIQHFIEIVEDIYTAELKGEIDYVAANLEIHNLKSRTGLRDYALNKEYLEPIRKKLERLYKSNSSNGASKKSLLLERYQAAKDTLGDRLKWNELKMAPELDGKPLDFDTIQITLAEETGLDFPEAHVRSVLLKLATEHSYDPIKDYLEQVYSQQKDDLLPLGNLGEILLGTTDLLYNTYLMRHLIGSVARRYQPGCKLDTLLVFKGRQGIKKSTFFQTLYGGDWFDSTPADTGSGKDELMRQHTHWCNELGELDGITSKKDAARMKAELSNPKDTFRPPYGRNTKEYPRRFVNVGTTNADSFLVDSTGDRRFWVIDLGNRMIDLAKVRELRDRIWATAVAAYKNGEQWWLTQEEQTQSSLVNEAYAVTDTWEDYILTFLNQEQQKSVTYTTVAWCLADSKLSIEPSKQSKADQNRCADILRRAGCTKGQTRIAGIPKKVWFLPPVSTPPGGYKGVDTAESSHQQSFEPSETSVSTPKQEKSKSSDEYSSSEMKNIESGVDTPSKNAQKPSPDSNCGVSTPAVSTPEVGTLPIGQWVRIPSKGNKLAQIVEYTPAGVLLKGEFKKDCICGVYPDAVPLTKEEMLRAGLRFS